MDRDPARSDNGQRVEFSVTRSRSQWDYSPTAEFRFASGSRSEGSRVVIPPRSKRFEIFQKLVDLLLLPGEATLIVRYSKEAIYKELL